MIFYFSGTGNTKWVAEQLAKTTGEELRYIPKELKKGLLHYELKDGERLGVCFPTHGWQPPHIVREFIRKSSFHLTPSTYVYAVTTCGDNMGYAMRIFQKELHTRNLHAQSLFAVVMPESNVCFSFLHLDTEERVQQKIAAARQRMQHICKVVVDRQGDVEELVKGAIPFTYTYIMWHIFGIYRLFFRRNILFFRRNKKRELFNLGFPLQFLAYKVVLLLDT